MKKLGLVAAGAIFLTVLAASIATAAAMPDQIVAAANANGSPAPDVAAASQQRPMITDDSIFSQFGYCDDNADTSPAAY